MEDRQPTTFSQEGIPQREKTLEDFFQIRGGVLNLIGILQTANFISGTRGVQIKNEGLTSSGGTINGATIGPSNTLTVAQGGTGASTLSGVLFGNGTSPVSTIVGFTGTFYAANSSGGSPTHLVTVTNGIITNIA